jgi:hypothetical protein
LNKNVLLIYYYAPRLKQNLATNDLHFVDHAKSTRFGRLGVFGEGGEGVHVVVVARGGWWVLEVFWIVANFKFRRLPPRAVTILL